MQVKTLIEYLETLNGDKEIYISKDSEGNSFGTLTEDSFYMTNSKKSIVLYPIQEHLEEEDLL